MPDIRELTLLDQMDATRFAVSRSNAFRARIRMGVRRLVVETSVPPLTYLYSAIYKLHLRYAVSVLRKIPGTRSIYLTGGLSSNDIRPGISDIDLDVTGDWTDNEQMQVGYAMQRLSAISPLYDRQLGINAHTVASLLAIYESDYFFQFRFNVGRARWKRLYGEDMFAVLPPVPAERVAGTCYAPVRGWWSLFVRSAFGFGITATDELFRNSITYKSVAGVQEVDVCLRSEPLKTSRKELMHDVLDHTSNPADRGFLERLQRSAARRHLRFEGDLLEEAFPYLIGLMERIHGHLDRLPTFQAVTSVMHVDGSADELMLAPGSREHIAAMVDFAKQTWPGYRSAALVPSVSFFYPDDLVLLLEVDPSQLPTVKQIKELCRRHVEATPSLRQRIALFLLLPGGAYQLEILNSTEMWHHTLCPGANPEVFELLVRPGFAVDGALLTPATPPVWTRFANDQLIEEITLRRAAVARAAEGAAGLSSLNLLRNLWRQVQLEVMARSSKSGQILVPVTVPAMLRALRSWGLPEDSVFSRLAEAYKAEMDGTPVNVHGMLPEVMGLMALFQ